MRVKPVEQIPRYQLSDSYDVIKEFQHCYMLIDDNGLEQFEYKYKFYVVHGSDKDAE